MKKKIVIMGGCQRYDEITFLRGFSIFTIVLMHLMQLFIPKLPTIVNTAAALGGTGVHVFFFCSGFGLYLSYIRKRTSYSLFLKKRFTKVYIPYVIVVIVSFFIPLIEVEGNRVLALISHLLLFKMFLPAYEESFGPFWFISTLFQFYLLFVPLCHFREKAGKKVFYSICIITSIVWWLFTGLSGLNTIRVIGSFFAQYLWEFALGMLFAECLNDGVNIEINNVVLVFVMVLGLGLEGILALKGSFLKAFNDVPALIGYGSLGLLLFQVLAIRNIGKKIGVFSYEWYLVHILVFTVFFGIIQPHDLKAQIITSVIAFLLSIFIAIGYRWLIQKTKITNMTK